MKTFKEWMNLTEGMSVMISGYNSNDNIKDFESIAEFIKGKVINPLWYQLTEEEKAAVRKGGSLHHGILAPDGSYYGRDGKEILNLYTGGWPDEQLNKMVKGVKYYLDEMKIKYSPFITDRSKMFDGDPVIRIPILSWKPTQDAPPSLDMNNSNTHLIFSDVLGYKGEEGGYFNLSPADLVVKIDNIENGKLQIHARDPYVSKRNNGPEMIHGGIDSSGIERRLEVIKQIAQWAMKNHYDNIYVA